MKAKIKECRSNGKNFSGDKEMVSSYNVVALDKGALKDAITCRCYMGRSKSAATVYASLWVHGKNEIYTAGHGNAGGYGYHKESAAIQAAITSAGVELFGDVYGRDEAKKNSRAHIDGVGDSAIEAALLAIAKAAGYRGKLLLVKN